MTTIRVDGFTMTFAVGDSVASAMIASGERTCRTTRSGEPRGLFCGSGVCGDCFVVIDGVPGVAACRTPVREGMVVQRQSARPALPRTAMQGGLATEPDEIELAPDVLVVGAGPAGMTAAAAIAESGLRVVIVDDAADPGGQFFTRPGDRSGGPTWLDTRARAGRALVRRLRDSGADLLSGARVWGASAADRVYAAGPVSRYVIRPRRLVLATGGHGWAEPFPGWTLPGVMTAAAAGRMLRVSGRVAGRRVLVTGSGPGNVVLADDLARAGATVAGVAEVAASPRLPDLARLVVAAAGSAGSPGRSGPLGRWQLARAGLLVRRIPVWGSAAMLACTGDDAVRGARLARLDREGLTIPGQTWDVEVDAVCVGHGIAPSTELAAGLGCELRVGPDGRPAVVRDAAGRTSVPGVWAIGDGSRFAGAGSAMIDGQRCGAALVQELRPDAAAPGVRQPDRANARQARRVERRARRLNRAGRVVAEVYPPWTPDLSAMDPQTVICRCENVTLAQLTAGLSDGIGSAGSLKRVTRAGMGSCQGRYCAGSLTRLAAAVTGIEPDPRSGFRPQLPSSPTRIGTIAAPEDTAYSR